MTEESRIRVAEKRQIMMPEPHIEIQDQGKSRVAVVAAEEVSDKARTQEGMSGLRDPVKGALTIDRLLEEAELASKVWEIFRRLDTCLFHHPPSR
ncbi:MAG: hypothetical protein QXK96_04400 [Candidatus Bathyarchaeia archaeon]